MAKIVNDSNLQEFGIKLKSKLSAVATSGSYTDLLNKPTIPSISDKEDISNKVTSISASSTDVQYPSAKCIYDEIGGIEDMIGDIDTVLDNIINDS